MDEIVTLYSQASCLTLAHYAFLCFFFNAFSISVLFLLSGVKAKNPKNDKILFLKSSEN